MSSHYIKTRRSCWKINDPVNAFQADSPQLVGFSSHKRTGGSHEALVNLNVEQQLTKFYDLLKKQHDPLVLSWISNWQSFFYGKTKKTKGMLTEKSTTGINLDMRDSVNQDCLFDNVNNYNNKRGCDDNVEGFPPPKKGLIGESKNTIHQHFRPPLPTLLYQLEAFHLGEPLRL